MSKVQLGSYVTAHLLPQPCPCLPLENRLSQEITEHQTPPGPTYPSRGTRNESGVESPLSEFSALWVTIFLLFLFLHVFPFEAF